MIPGRFMRCSETVLPSADTLKVTHDIMILTGTVQLNTLLPAAGFMGAECQMVVILTQGIVVIGTTGNILVGTTTVVNRPVVLVWSRNLQKWAIVGGAASV